MLRCLTGRVIQSLKNSGSCPKLTVALSSNRSISSAHYSTSSTTKQQPYDLAIIGGGIVGLATGRELLLRSPKLRLLLVEKEAELSRHQSGHNSGVIHAGVYYVPGSLKARLCVDGLKRTYVYCDQKGIPYKKAGKLIVAVTPEELPRLEELRKRGEANGVPEMRVISGEEIREIEPHCVGLKAIHSPLTGIIDWRIVALSYAEDIREAGGHILTKFEVEAIDTVAADRPITINSKDGRQALCRHVITCGGLHSDRLAEMSGCTREPRIVPFRGDYLLLKPEKQHLVRGNIYPVPDPRFPFLGVHFTPRIDGSVWLGPNAVLAFKREGYKLLDFNPRDTYDALSYSGLRRIAWRHLGTGLDEMRRGIFISGTVKMLQKFIPELKLEDVIRGPSGVRAQALSPAGELVDDFVFDAGQGESGQRVLHVRNAPSPAATSSLSIAVMVADKAIAQFKHLSIPSR